MEQIECVQVYVYSSFSIVCVRSGSMKDTAVGSILFVVPFRSAFVVVNPIMSVQNSFALLNIQHSWEKSNFYRSKKYFKKYFGALYQICLGL